MAEYDIKELKRNGFIKQKEGDLFALRLRSVGGSITSEQLAQLSKISEKYGSGNVHLTTRQGVEIQNVNFKDFEVVKKALAEVNLEMGVSGPRVRAVIACPGKQCRHGFIDTLALARKIDAEFYGQGGLPGKFKIAVTGCPNSCAKPQENDLGIMGQLRKEFVRENCVYCGACERACPSGAIQVTREEREIVFTQDKCLSCKNCVTACPRGAWQKRQEGYAIFVGGKIGKFPKLGIKVFDFIEGDEKVLEIIRRTLHFYKKYGKPRERFRAVLDRVGVDTYMKEVAIR